MGGVGVVVAVAVGVVSPSAVVAQMGLVVEVLHVVRFYCVGVLLLVVNG